MEIKNYPDSTGLKNSVDNISIWPDGNKGNFGSLKYIVTNKINIIQSKIYELEDLFSRHHTKKVKGRTYWYLVENGFWKYIGKKDPRPAIRQKITKLKESIEINKQTMNACIIKKIGYHLLIDIKIFKQEVSKTLPYGSFSLKEVIQDIMFEPGCNWIKKDIQKNTRNPEPARIKKKYPWTRSSEEIRTDNL